MASSSNNENNNEPKSKKRGGSQKRSWVWEWFSSDDETGLALCQVKVSGGQICNKQYKNGSSTGVLIDHLSNKHQITKGLNKEDYVPSTSHEPEITPHKESRQVELRNLLVNWIIFDSRPLNTIQSESFHKFIKELDPAFTIPDIRLIKKTIQSAYNNTFPLIQEFVENNSISVNLTTDMWTGRNRQGFLGVTCCFLDKDFVIHEIILTIEYLRYPHTAQSISDALLIILDEWGLREKVHMITTDNGANMKKAIVEMSDVAPNIKWQSCVAHTLQLVVGKGLRSAKLLVLRAKRLIDFFLRPKQSERLENIQKKSQIQVDVDVGQTSDYILHLIADISTRWNSSYYAWDRLIKIKSYIQSLVPELINSTDLDDKKDGKHLEKIMLSSDEWDILKELILILGPFEEATRYLGGEKYITYSIMSPIIEQIKNLLLSSSSSNSPTPASPITSFNTTEIFQEIENADDVFVLIEEVEIQENEAISKNNNNQIQKKIDLNRLFETKDALNEVKKDLYDAMCYYWSSVSNDSLLSTILDPRVKSMGKRVEEEEVLRKYYEEYQENYLPTPIDSRPTSPTPSDIPIYKPKLFSIFEQNQPKATDEVEEYLREDKIPFNQCPFNW